MSGKKIINLRHITSRKRRNPPSDEEPVTPPHTPREKEEVQEKVKNKKVSRPRYEAKVSDLQELIALADSPNDYCNLDMRSLRRIKEPLLELDRLVGMKRLKESIFNQIIYYLQKLDIKGSDYLHTALYGAPGCGKTTVAKIIGSIFSKLGILSRKTFDTATRDDLIAGYLGQTAIQTAMVLTASKGGVLFIDEIYSLGEREKRDSFSKECIDTINLFLSENKEDFMLIVAGYEKEVQECFFNVNSGLERRFMWHHHIDPYTPEDLAEIMVRKVEDIKWKLDEDVTGEWLTTFLKENDKKFKYAGGDIDNFLTICKIKHARRILGESEDKLRTITRHDIKESIKEFRKDKEEKRNDPPPGMYT